MTVAELQAKFAKCGKTLGEICVEIGLSRATISQVINGKYQGKPEVVGRVEQYLTELAPDEAEAVRDTEVSEVSECEFRLTQGQKRGMVILNMLRSKRKFGVLIGSSGIGKTRLLEEFQKYHKEVFILRILEGQSKSGILTEICDLWGIQTHGTKDQKIKRLHEAANGKCLCVDEADNLTRNRTGKHLLELIAIFRNLYEAGASIILVGLNSIVDDVKSIKETYILSRLRYCKIIDDPDESDMMRMWACKGVDTESSVLSTITQQAKKNGFFRFLNELSDAVSELGSIEEALPVMFKI